MAVTAAAWVLGKVLVVTAYPGSSPLHLVPSRLDMAGSVVALLRLRTWPCYLNSASLADDPGGASMAAVALIVAIADMAAIASAR